MINAKFMNPKYIRRLSRRVTFLSILMGVYIFKAEERAYEQERKIDRLDRELKELKRREGV